MADRDKRSIARPSATDSHRWLCGSCGTAIASLEKGVLYCPAGSVWDEREKCMKLTPKAVQEYRRYKRLPRLTKPCDTPILLSCFHCGSVQLVDAKE